jgi:hypothetical protein
VYFSLPNIINPVYIQQLGEMIPPPSQNNVGVCNQVTLLILYYITSRLVPPLKLIDTPIQVSDILVLAAGCCLTQTYTRARRSVTYIDAGHYLTRQITILFRAYAEKETKFNGPCLRLFLLSRSENRFLLHCD